MSAPARRAEALSAEAPPTPAVPSLSWALCVATYERADVLSRCVECALAQTRPPAEIVIVDASEDWRATRGAIERLCGSYPAVALKYLPSEIRSSASQRNRAIEAAAADVLFLIDDDSLMHAECAERVMDVYQADADGVLAGVSAVHVPDLPAAAAVTAARKASGVRRHSGLRQRLLTTRAGRWLNAKVLLQKKEELFLRYEGERPDLAPPGWVAALPASVVTFMPGYAMTVRRRVALTERFESSLRFYTAFEDLDASYRYRRHGMLLKLRSARLHHFEAASGRIGRSAAIALQLLNMLVFIKRNAERPQAHFGRFRRMLARRLLGEALKDLAAGRWSLPQARGVLLAMRLWGEVRAVPADRLDDWYPGFQAALIARAPAN